MSFGILPSILVTLFVLVGVALGALFGLLRGFKRSIVTLSGTIVAAVLAFFLASPIASLISNMIFSAIDMGSVKEIIAASPAAEELMKALPAAIVAPLLFVVLFMILKLIIKIPCCIISRFMGPKSTLRPIGIPLGAIQGLISSLVVVFVITGMVGVADNVTDTILNDSSEATADLRESVEAIDDVIDSFKNDPIANLICGPKSGKSDDSMSVNFVYSGLSTFKFRGTTVSLSNEIVNIADTVVCILPVTSNTDIANWTDEEITAVENFANKLNNSKIIISIGTDLVSGLSQKWANDEEFLGITRPKINTTVDPLMESLVVSLQTTTDETITEDINTVVEIIKVIYKHDVLKNFNDENASDSLLKTLSGEFISELLTVLSNNERFNVLVPEVANLGLRLLASTLELPENAQEVYQDTVNQISTSLNTVLATGATEESIAQFSDEMKDTLAANGINIAEEVSVEIANAIVNNFADESEVTPEKIEEYFRDFATVYSAIEDADISQTGQNSSGFVNLSGNNSIVGVNPRGTYDTSSMSYTEKIQLLASFGVYDHYSAMHDLSKPTNMLSNGKSAEAYVTYLINIINTAASNYDNIGKMGSSKNNPLISMGSPETIITTKVTAADLTVSSDMNLSKDDIEQFGKSFEAITTFIDSYSKLEGDLTLDQLQNVDIEAAGQALDMLKSVSALSNTVDNISNAVISKVVGTNINISDKMSDGSTSYKELFTTVKATAQVISNITNTDADDAQKEEAILELLINLTPGTAGVVNEIITEDFVIKQGAPKESAPASVKALRTAFVEMANLSGEEHDREAAYVTRMFDLAFSVKDNDQSNNIIGENGIFKSEDELVSMSIHSKVAAAALQSITIDENGNPVYDALKIANKLTDKNREDVVKSLEKNYNEQKVGMTNEEVSDLEAKIFSVSYLLNLEIDFIK